MGVIYSVFPLVSEITEWLDKEGIPYPAISNPRMPTLVELDEALEHLDGVEVSDSGLIQSTDPARPGEWTQIVITDTDSGEGACEFYFSKGSDEVVLRVLQKVTALCGPHVVLDDSATWPVLVTPEEPLEDLLLRYRNPWPDDD
ncbi:hypothetical protein OJ996_24980 [Luteolibacter sp. GHJ8]|uniref:Uncharacterized protein n=1 Tax=Luteolibacter rhizosphaerae TaxID=2989719 RepID=A0ABT3GAK9_9BACT|nr:hypothetical protein [Luteolibacter rhizosphaerae]MCW1916867.1 hypothetical protein [Luteolibacter rhizosphaerae]